MWTVPGLPQLPAPALAPTQIYLPMFLPAEDNDTTDSRHQHTVMAGTFHYIYHHIQAEDSCSLLRYMLKMQAYRRDGRGRWGVQYTTLWRRQRKMLNESWTNLNPRSLCSPHLQRGSSRIPLSGILPHFIFSAYYTTAKPGAVLSIQFSPTPVCNKFHLSSRTRHLLSLASPGCIYQGQGSLL